MSGFAWGVLAGAIIGNFLIQAYGAFREGLRLPSGVPFANPVVREYLLLALPLMLGQSLVVLDESFARVFGTQLGEGPTSQLGFARQTMLVPIGVVAQAAGVAAYPYLSRLVEEGKLREMTVSLARAVRYVLVASFVATAALVALSVPAIRALFERGQFGPADTVASASALVFYALGIPFWGVQQLLARGFYARRQMWTPVIVGTAATVLAVPAYIIFKELMGIQGIALASTISIAVYTIVLGAIWIDRTGSHVLAGFAQTLVRALVPALVACGAAWLVSYAVADLATGFVGVVLQLAAGGAAAGAAFLGLAGWMGTMKRVADD